jgi:hypothetical protein
MPERSEEVLGSLFPSQLDSLAHAQSLKWIGFQSHPSACVLSTRPTRLWLPNIGLLTLTTLHSRVCTHELKYENQLPPTFPSMPSMKPAHMPSIGASCRAKMLQGGMPSPEARTRPSRRSPTYRPRAVLLPADAACSSNHFFQSLALTALPSHLHTPHSLRHCRTPVPPSHSKSLRLLGMDDCSLKCMMKTGPHTTEPPSHYNGTETGQSHK